LALPGTVRPLLDNVHEIAHRNSPRR
jgi:hypothetical protein